MSRRWVFALLIGLLAAGGCASPGDRWDSNSAIDVDELVPDPEWTAEEVVRIVLVSMQHNDEPRPDAGIETAFRFASPASRAVTGPLDRFATLVKTPHYEPLIRSRSIAISPLILTAESAEVVVRVTDAEDERAYYYLKLSRQAEGEFSGCWMMDAMMPVEPLDREDGDDRLPRRRHRPQYVAVLRWSTAV